MHYTIYQIINNSNGFVYIGKHQTKNIDDGYMGSGVIIKRVINKHGPENFTKQILFDFETEEEMNLKEKELVTEEFCLREDTYNLCAGGHGGWSFINRTGKNLRTGMVHTEESRSKMGHWAGKEGPMKGRTTSDETKAKLSSVMPEKLKGRTLSEEHKRKIAESLRKRKGEVTK